MLPKIILLVSCLYIVQATFVINAPDDSSVENDNKPLAEGDADLSDDFKFKVSEDNSDAASTLATVCTNPACHNFCRSRGYAWGVCVGAYVCRCYRYGLALNENKDGAENAVEVNKDEDNDDVRELNDGDVNFAVDFESDEVPPEDTSEAAAALAARACNNSNCNRFCRARGYARGRCVSSRVCRCYRYKTTLWDGEDEAESEKKTNPKADMEKSTFNGQQAPQENLGVVNKLASARACNARICNRNCRALRYDRGICIISRCQCLGRPIRIAFANVLENVINENGLAETENDAANEVETNDIADSVPSSFDGDLDEPEENLNTASRSVNVVSPTPGCDPVACGKICRGLGYTYGTCFLRRCQCHRNGRVRSAFSNVADNDINDNSIPEADIYNTEPVLSDPLLSQEAVPAPRASNCVLRWCEQTCRRMGFSGGACVNGRCKCDILRRALPWPIPAPLSQEAVPTPRASNCVLRWCEQTCRRMGFPGGACVNGRCKCDILRSALPWPIPAPRKDVIRSLKGKCVDYQCTEICRRMRYRGGLCTADSCICFM